MKKKILTILKYILIGISVFVGIWVFVIRIIYIVEGDNIWNYMKEFWNWYKTLL